MVAQLVVITGRPFTEVLDMDNQEIEATFEAYQVLNRDKWEQTRIISYTNAAPNFKKPITIHKYMPLAWDVESAAKPTSAIDPEEFNRLVAQAKEFNKQKHGK